MSAVGWTMERDACGASSEIPPSVGSGMTTAATGSRIPPPTGHGGLSVLSNAA